jgi:outer membrane receptor for ferrienterochelin and colicin
VPVTVVGREEIERRDARSVLDLIRDIPGVESSGVPRTTAMQPVIRGLGDERIVLRTDGARNNFNADHRGRTFVDPELLRQVEVLRGPGSSLYGSGALGGVISLRTIEVEDILQPGERFWKGVKHQDPHGPQFGGREPCYVVRRGPDGLADNRIRHAVPRHLPCQGGGHR